MPGPPSTGRDVARRLWWEVYLPLFPSQLAVGILLPVIPLYLRSNGFTYGETTTVLAAAGLGAVLGGLPTGATAQRLGPEWVFVVATLLSGASAALFGLSTAMVALIAFRVAAGGGAVGLRIAAQMLVRDATPMRWWGRAMSVLGGLLRAALFVGPILGGLLVDGIGFTATFVVAGALAVTGLIPFGAARRERPPGQRFVRPAPGGVGLWRALANHGGLLALAGVGTALVMSVREGRNVVVPLIGDELGLSATAVGILVAIGTGADLLLFPVAGWLMDRFGRLAAIVPSFALLGSGMLLLGSWPTTAGAVTAGAVMGVGNGIGSGTLLTVGVDLAPPDAGPFLAALGLLQDLGVLLGPLVVGWLADSAGLYRSAIVLGIMMFVAVTWIVVVLGDTARPSRPWLVARIRSPGRAPG